MVISWLSLGDSPSFKTSFLVKWVIVQKRNKIQAALINADIVLTILATIAGSLTN